MHLLYRAGQIFALTMLFLAVPSASIADDGEIVTLCRQYLAAKADDRLELEKQIEAYDGPVQPILDALAEEAPTDWHSESSVILNQSFMSPDLQALFPEDLLHYFIPEDYRPNQPIGLLIFMHGGGRQTPRDDPRHVVTDLEDDSGSYRLQPHFKDTQFIIAAPSAPWNEKTGARWNVPEADEYLKAVIRECRYRFNIDTDRIFLGGYSMGGFGAFHLAPRLNDRLAGAVIFSGAWRTAHWKAWNGLPVFMRHGKWDASPPGTEGKNPRPRFTDVFFSRIAKERLANLSTDLVYVEDEFGHAIRDATEAMSQLPRWMTKQKRNPFPRHVVAVSPRGWNAARDTSTPNCHWVTILETGEGTLEFDAVEREGPAPAFGETREDFEAQSLKVVSKSFRAGLVDAEIKESKRIEIRTRNVRKFSLWLHPSMIDFSQPVRVSVNGQLTEHKLKQDLLTALRSYLEREEWRLVCPAEIELVGSP